MARIVLRRACWAKAVSLSKVMDLRSAGSMRAKTASMTETIGGSLPDESGCERHAGFALMENEHGRCALADDEVALPMADLSSGIDILGPLVDGDAILDRISRRPRSARAPGVVTSSEITPRLLGLVGGAIDEGINRLAPHGPQTTFISALQPARDLL